MRRRAYTRAGLPRPARFCLGTAMANWPSPGPIAGAGARPDLGERWPSRLVATAASTGLIPRELNCPPQGQLIKQDAAKNGLR